MSNSAEIIKTALLGTSKYLPTPPAALAALHSKITAVQQDKEDAFLRYAASVLLYEECGREPLEIEHGIAECPAETKIVLHPKTADALKMALGEKDDVLIDYILFHAHARGLVAPAALAPMILNRAVEKKGMRQGLLQLSGVTGTWLMGINPAWKALEGRLIGEDDTWETGNHEARKLILAELRSSNPAEAIPLLEAAFPQENANNREELLRLLEIGLSVDDAPFLEAQLSDKSKKVKEAVMLLLRQLRGGRIQEILLDFVRRAFVIKEERYMVFSKRKLLDIDSNAMPQAEFFDCLITKVSSQKGVSDVIYWLAQAIESVHPDDWMPALGLTPTDLLARLTVLDEDGVLLNHLLRGAIKFRHHGLALAFLAANTGAHVALLRLVSPAEGLPYYDRAMDASIEAFIDYLMVDGYPTIRKDVAFKVLHSLHASPYRITQPIYRKLALHLPAEMNDILKTYASESGNENYQIRYFATQASEMLHVLETKENLKF